MTSRTPGAGTPARPRPSAAGPSASSAATPASGQSANPSPGPNPNIRKRKNHRAGKKKQRRKSFAIMPPPSIGGDDGDNGDVETDPLKDAAQTAAASRDDFYGIHNRNRGRSNSSIESESLLDHRDQPPFLRARRPSMAAAASLSQSTRLNLRGDDDEGAPLLPQSRGGSDMPSATSARAAAFAGYGTTNNNDGGGGQGSRPGSRHGSSHSSLRRKFLNPFSTASTEHRYSVNYPPSVPGSPPLRPTDRMLDHNNLSFGDQMLRDELRSPSPPPLQLRRSDTAASIRNLIRGNDAAGDREQPRGREGTGGGGGGGGDFKDDDTQQPPTPSHATSRHRASMLGGVGIGAAVGAGGGGGEDDVCFPQERLSEIAEDEAYDDEHGGAEDDERDAAAWRTRTANRRRRGKWPDLAILDEWSRFEKEGRSEGRRAKKIKEPQLVNGRLRPVHRGWHRAEEDAPYRFTYFNEEFQSTIHSQSISELVQPTGGSFRELFIPDPPVLSDSEDEEDELEAEIAVASYDDAEGDSERTMAGLHGDAFNPFSPMNNIAHNLSRDPLHVAEALSNAGDSYHRPGTRSGGSVSPDKDSNNNYVSMERTPTQASEDNRPPQLAFKSPPRVLSPPHAGTPDLYPARTLTPQPQSQPSQSNGDATRRPSKQPRYGERPVWWLDVLSPTEAEMKILSKAFGIHPLTAEDIVMQEAREKVELFHHYYFVSYRSFDQDPSSETFLDPVNVYVVVFREGVLSFHFSMTPHPANVRRRIRQLSDYMILSSDWISYAIIDDITDVFVPLIQKIEQEVDDIDDEILQMHSAVTGGLSGKSKHAEESGGGGGPAATAEADTNMLMRVGDCRKRVMGLYRLLGNKADVIKGFAKRCNEHWEVAPRSEIGLYLGDIQDHIVTMTSNLSHYEKILSRSHGNYLAQINIRMNERQEQTADVLGKLTVLGTIVLPMNIITGLWGMNVWVPGQQVEGDLRWFLVITAGLLAFGMACYWIAKRVYKIV